MKYGKWYKKLIADGFSDVKEKWLSMAPMIGQRVQVMSGDEVIAERR